jgi:enamine deaminase RidA (YjgF/YER057c/UK114 family)
LLFIGGNIGRIDGVLKYRGKVGAEVTLDQAYEAARNCGLNHLAIMKAALGDLDKVERIVKVLGYVNVAPGFTDMPRVVNGESDLLVQLFGDRGTHTRAAIGVASLSQNAPVENEVIVQVKE